MNNFGCLARDLNLAVFSMVIFLSTFKRRLLTRLILTSEEAFNLAKVAIGFIQAMIFAIQEQIFNVYICSVESMLSLTLDPE